MLSHSGVFASSKSASHTLAPELSALIVIFLSVGPVISTRRSASPGAGDATCQERSSLTWLGLRQEVQRRAGDELLLAAGPGGEELARAAGQLPVQGRDQGERLAGQDLVVPVAGRAGDLDALGLGHAWLLPVAGNIARAHALPARRP